MLKKEWREMVRKMTAELGRNMLGPIRGRGDGDNLPSVFSYGVEKSRHDHLASVRVGYDAAYYLGWGE